MVRITGFIIVHRPGKIHNNADGLSRIPCGTCTNEATRKQRYTRAKQPTMPVHGPTCNNVPRGAELGRNKKSEPHILRALTDPVHNGGSIQSLYRVNTRVQVQSYSNVSQWMETKSVDDIVDEQGKDDKISVILEWKNSSSNRPNCDQVLHLDSDIKAYWSQ